MPSIKQGQWGYLLTTYVSPRYTGPPVIPKPSLSARGHVRDRIQRGCVRWSQQTVPMPAYLPRRRQQCHQEAANTVSISRLNGRPVHVWFGREGAPVPTPVLAQHLASCRYFVEWWQVSAWIRGAPLGLVLELCERQYDRN